MKQINSVNIDLAEKQFAAEWEEYCKENPDADGADYIDMREAFFEGVFGGDAKHF